MILSETDRDHMNHLVAETEKRLGIQIVLAVVRRSDSYAEIPWKAFAIGTAISGLLLFILNLVQPFWYSTTLVLYSIAATLALGAFLSLLVILIPGCARGFLSAHRAEEEVKQFAESVFLLHELFATRNRTGVLLFVSLFERKVYLLPDKGIKNRFDANGMKHVIGSMIPLLRRNKLTEAFGAGLDHLSAILESRGGQNAFNDHDDELSNEIIEEEGA